MNKIVWLIVHELKYDMIPVFLKKRAAKSEFELELKAFDENYINYLEENDSILFGWNTPMFVAKFNSSLSNDTESNIYYQKVHYVRKFSYNIFLITPVNVNIVKLMYRLYPVQG